MVKKTPWYVGGLHFECMQCGGCCAGPGTGYIWVTRPEIALIADFLKKTTEQVRQEYLKRIGLRTTIIEQPSTRDCIFLNHGFGFPLSRGRSPLRRGEGPQSGGPHGLHGGQKICMIYPVRPSQCRIWPFWPENVTNLDAWNKVAQKCPGINRGKFYSFEEIEKIKKNKKWWQDTEQTISSLRE